MCRSVILEQNQIAARQFYIISFGNQKIASNFLWNGTQAVPYAHTSSNSNLFFCPGNGAGEGKTERNRKEPEETEKNRKKPKRTEREPKGNRKEPKETNNNNRINNKISINNKNRIKTKTDTKSEKYKTSFCRLSRRYLFFIIFEKRLVFCRMKG